MSPETKAQSQAHELFSRAGLLRIRTLFCALMHYKWILTLAFTKCLLVDIHRTRICAFIAFISPINYIG